MEATSQRFEDFVTPKDAEQVQFCWDFTCLPVGLTIFDGEKPWFTLGIFQGL